MPGGNKKQASISYQKTKTRDKTEDEQNNFGLGPYWADFHESGQDNENVLANPDVLEETAPTPWNQPEAGPFGEEILERLKGFNFATILTPIEQQVIKLVVTEGKSVLEIKKITKMSKQRIYYLLASIGKKIRKHLNLEEK